MHILIYKSANDIYLIESGIIVSLMSLERFMKVYSNVPINLRKEIILVIDDQPITWNVAYLEIKNDTLLGKKILQKLLELEII